MDYIGLGLVGVYALLMSFWWFTMKCLFRLGGPEDQDSLSTVVKSVSGLGAGVLVAAALWENGFRHYLCSVPASFWGWLTATIVLNIFIAHFYVKAMEKSVASVAVHVTALAPMVAIGTAWFFLDKELPGPVGVVGIVTIPLGLYILHFNPRHYGLNLAGPVIEVWQKRGNWLWYALGVAVFAGCSLPIDKKCVLLGDHLIAPGLTLLVAWGLFWGSKSVVTGNWRRVVLLPKWKVFTALLLLAACFGVANGFQAAAYYYGFAASVGSLKRLDAPLTVLWAWLFLRREERGEGHLAFRIAGSITAFTGAFLIWLDGVV